VTCSQGQSAIADYNTQFNISPQVSMIRGRHSFVFGAQLEEGYDNYLQTKHRRRAYFLQWLLDAELGAQFRRSYWRS